MFEVTDEQTPLVTTALKYLVDVKLPIVEPDNVNEFVPMLFGVVNAKSFDHCHWIIPVALPMEISAGCVLVQIF